MKFDRRGVILIAIICFAPFAYWAYNPMEPDNWVSLDRNPAIEISERWSVTGSYERYRVGSEIFDSRTHAENYLAEITPETPQYDGPKNCLVDVRDDAGKLIAQEYVPTADPRCSQE